MEHKIRETVNAYFRLVNEEAFDAFFALFHDDVVFSAPFGFRAQGLEQVKPFYLQVPVNYPEHVDTPEAVLVSGNRAAVFIDFVGRTKDGRPVAFKASDWFEFADGKIQSLHVFFDSHALSRQLKGKARHG